MLLQSCPRELQQVASMQLPRQHSEEAEQAVPPGLQQHPVNPHAVESAQTNPVQQDVKSPAWQPALSAVQHMPSLQLSPQHWAESVQVAPYSLHEQTLFMQLSAVQQSELSRHPRDASLHAVQCACSPKPDKG